MIDIGGLCRTRGVSTDQKILKCTLVIHLSGEVMLCRLKSVHS